MMSHLYGRGGQNLIFSYAILCGNKGGGSKNPDFCEIIYDRPRSYCNANYLALKTAFTPMSKGALGITNVSTKPKHPAQ